MTQFHLVNKASPCNPTDKSEETKVEERDNFPTSSKFFEIIAPSSEQKKESSLDSDWLDVDEAALYLRIFRKDGTPCTQRIRNLVSMGRIPFYKPFGRLLFKRDELKAFIENSRKGVFKCR